VQLIDRQRQHPPSQAARGINAAQCRDPDGNLIEVFSPLKN
jgi:hypothetical protein